MSLHTSLKEELKTAMKQKDSARLQVIRSILSELTNELVRQNQKPQAELPDEAVLTVISRLVKQRRDSVTQYQKGGREDLAESEQAELEILSRYLPEPLSKEQIIAKAQQKQLELGIVNDNQKGQLIGALMKDLKGQADGSVVKEVVEEILASK